METSARHNGFTLIELVVALAVLGILVAIGLPSFNAAIANSRISSQYNDTIGALFIARSEAVKSSGNITVCARTDNQAETCKQGGGDWSDGIVVFQDNFPVAADGDVVIGDEDEVLYLEPALSGDNTLTFAGSLNNSAADSDPYSFLTYTPNGSTNWRGAALTLCDDRGATEARAINIVLTGDIRRGRPAPNGDVPIDAFNNPVVCPTTVSE